jgi:hypothetical protein
MSGISTSSGLNNALSSTNTQQTTLPSWYTTAQQNVINQAGNALGQAPGLNQTTAQGAINTLTGNQNPFSQAQNTLNTIATGSANPFNVNANGTVSPNVNTALGSLFQAQDQQLNTILPYATAPVEGANIASGNFGSLRGQQATDTARAVAQSNLTSSQLQSALQNQQTGATAAGALGNVGAQGVTADLTAGATQMNAPFQGATNYANLVNAVNAPGTVSQQVQLSPLQMISQLAGLPSTAGNLLTSIFGQGSGTPGTPGYAAPGLLSLINQYFGSNPSSNGTTSSTDSSGNSTVTLNNGNGSVSTSTPINDPYTTSTGGDATAPVVQE